MASLRCLLFGHGGYLNRGCEAIVRSTTVILKEKFPKIEVDVASFHFESDQKHQVPGIVHCIPHGIYPRRWTSGWVKGLYYNYICRKPEVMQRFVQQKVIWHGLTSDCIFSVGGDNYCYGEPYQLYAIDDALKAAKKHIILWGCSIDASKISSRMLRDLRLFDLITARESVTYNALLDHGINKNTYLYPDPAFTLDVENLPLPENWMEGNMIGLNLSPLVMHLEKSSGIAYRSTYELVSHILKSSDYGVALIPHVTWIYNNDLEPLIQLYDSFKDSGRIVLIGEGYNAPQLKGFISRCKMFIGARTHATIAAYSTCVPTLVLGYSVKARGIARDIFGDEKGLVLPVQELESEKQLIGAFEGLREREQELREHLNKVMPAYQARAKDAALHVRALAESCGS